MSHRHTCLDCGTVIAEGNFDCELDRDHDFERCRDCVKGYKLESIGRELKRLGQEHRAITERLADLRAQFHEVETRKAELDKDMDQLEAELTALKKDGEEP